MDSACRREWRYIPRYRRGYLLGGCEFDRYVADEFCLFVLTLFEPSEKRASGYVALYLDRSANCIYVKMRCRSWLLKWSAVRGVAAGAAIYWPTAHWKKDFFLLFWTRFLLMTAFSLGQDLKRDVAICVPIGTVYAILSALEDTAGVPFAVVTPSQPAFSARSTGKTVILLS